MIAPIRRARLVVALVGMVAASGGCDDTSERVVVATSWTEAECAEIEASFGPSRIGWVRLRPGGDPAALVDRHERIDVILGGPIASYQRLASRERLRPIGPASDERWCVARRSPLGLAINRGACEAAGRQAPTDWAALEAPEWLGRIAVGDPRRDPTTLALAVSRLEAAGWAEGYAQIVRLAARARPIGTGATEALAAVVSGAAAVAPATAAQAAALPKIAFIPLGGDALEGAGIVAGTARTELASELLRPLASRERSAATGSRSVARASARAQALLADLLGATLVDAQDDLRAAWVALERSGHTPRAERWFMTAPPWPPASIPKMAEQVSSRGEDPDEWVATLTEQIAPESDVRSWLARTWRQESRPIDGAWLETLARAVDGRVFESPRFRAWLRAEWTAWAQQRYRRVARLAGAEPP